MSDRIRVLLVDDKPEGLGWDSFRGRPALFDEVAELFELIWIQNAREARWLLDAFDVLSIRAPNELLDVGLPAEILIFDYALTQGVERRRPASDSTYRIPQIKRTLERYGVDLGAATPHSVEDPPNTGTALGKDRMGCYVGGEFARAFAAHPCGAVPTTAHVDTSDSDAAFYEWLNQQYFMDLFKDKSRAPTWNVLLSLGVQCLRKRIAHLAAAGVIRVELECLRALATAPETARNRRLVVHSRFGRRGLPVGGLFVDSLLPGNVDHSAFIGAAQRWSEQILADLFKGHGREEFSEAKDLAESYWRAYWSETAWEREELSTLAARSSRNTAEENRLEELCERAGVSLAEVRTSPEKVRVSKAGYFLRHWRDVASSAAVARWAALLLAVRAERLHRFGTEDAERFESLLTEEDKETGEVLRHELEFRGGKEEVARLIEVLRLEPEWSGDTEWIKLPTTRAAEVSDILIRLDPLPEKIFLYKHKRQAAGGRRIPDPTSLTNALKRLGHTGGGWGPLGLSLTDVLEDRPFNCELCRTAIEEGESPPFGEHEDEIKKRFRHGIRKGEGALLRIFADEIAFPESRWPMWLRRAP